MLPPFPRLYAIVDAAWIAPHSLANVTRDLLDAGVRLFQYRDKKGNSRETFEASLLMIRLIRPLGGMLIVNDRADVAWAAGADGVHLGQDDLPAEMARRILPHGMIVGISTHSVTQVEEADRGPADYIAFGPVFATRSKEQPDPAVGPDGVGTVRKLTQKPLVAIGGITIENAREVVKYGADSIAVIGALLGAPDRRERARQFLEELA
ncbi:MAG: thiamine phosphate synthase [Terriglobia bacterium]